MLDCVVVVTVLTLVCRPRIYCDQNLHAPELPLASWQSKIPALDRFLRRLSGLLPNAAPPMKPLNHEVHHLPCLDTTLRPKHAQVASCHGVLLKAAMEWWPYPQLTSLFTMSSNALPRGNACNPCRIRKVVSAKTSLLSRCLICISNL